MGMTCPDAVCSSSSTLTSALVRSRPPTTASLNRRLIAARDQPSNCSASRIDCLFTVANCFWVTVLGIAQSLPITILATGIAHVSFSRRAARSVLRGTCLPSSRYERRRYRTSRDRAWQSERGMVDEDAVVDILLRVNAEESRGWDITVCSLPPLPEVGILGKGREGRLRAVPTSRYSYPHPNRVQIRSYFHSGRDGYSPPRLRLH